jgi:hypothetical protein
MRTAVRERPDATTAISLEIAREIAQEAYVWGFPLVLMDLTRRVQTNTEALDGRTGRAPLNQFGHMAAFPPATFRAVVRPNFDTLYSIAWLDLNEDALVMTLPQTDRYHVFQVMDAWTEVFAAPGTRMTGSEGGAYLIVGPAWQGEAPRGMTLLRCPTPHAWIIGRIQTNTAEDYDVVNGLQAQVELNPLGRWGAAGSPSAGELDPSVDMKTPPVVAVGNMDGEAFFTRLMEALRKDPPLIHDQGIVARMKRLGLHPGRSLDVEALPAPIQQALEDGAAAGLKAIRRRAKTLLGTPRNGWIMPTGAIGAYGADYLFRAAIALYGLGANRPEDAVYPALEVDADGRAPSGASRYVLRFPSGQTPPVHGFWSVTMYDEQGFPVQNALERYAIGDRDALVFDDDGSLTLLVQHESPGMDKEPNWLPSPAGPFTLTMRCYSPRLEIASGDWVPPPLTRVDGARDEGG